MPQSRRDKKKGIFPDCGLMETMKVEVFRFLFESGNRMAERYYRKCRKEGKDTKGIINTYLTGFCDGIREVLDRQCTALMLTVLEDVENSFREYSKGFHKTERKLDTSNDARAYKVWKEEWKDTALTRGIEAQIDINGIKDRI